MRWQTANEAHIYKHRVGCNHLISNKREWNNTVLFKIPTKYREFFLTLFVKTTNFQLVFTFEQMRTVTIIIWRVRYMYNDSYTTMAKQ